MEAQSEQGVTPLMLAAGSEADNVVEVVRYIVCMGGRLDTRDHCDVNGHGTGGGVLHKACCSGRVEVVEALLQLGTDVNAVDQDKWTALHFAARFNHGPIVETLVSHGANVNAQDVDGWTALHNCSRNGRVKCVEQLLGAGTCLRLLTKTKETALHVACRQGKVKVAEAILKHALATSVDELHALLSGRDMQGRTVFDLAANKYIQEHLNSFKVYLKKTGIDVDHQVGGGPGMKTTHAHTLPSQSSWKSAKVRLWTMLSYSRQAPASS